ncbi:MAG: RNA 2',3'-cyclic phosphodiesterase [Acidobacteriota bacterium]
MEERRIFVAIDISEQVRAVCDGHIDYLRNKFPDARVSWETTEKLHITMKFLGNTSSDVFDALQSSVAEIAAKHRAFRLRLSRTGLFPRESRPRVLWIGLDDRPQAVTPLYSELDSVCEGLGYPKEPRAFRPHITIGRVRDPDEASELAAIHLKTKIEPVEFEVNEIVICESTLQTTGSVYSVISTARLGPSI